MAEPDFKKMEANSNILDSEFYAESDFLIKTISFF